MSKNDLKLSKEFGVNPTIPVCFYCGEEKNEVALLGAGFKKKDPTTGKYKEAQAPRKMVLDIEPCDKCKKKYKDYVLLVEVSDEHHQEPTGRWCAMHKDNLNVPYQPIAYMTEMDFNDLMRRFIHEKK